MSLRKKNTLLSVIKNLARSISRLLKAKFHDAIQRASWNLALISFWRATENMWVENAGTSKVQGWRMWEWIRSVGTRMQGWKIRDKQVWTARCLINTTYLKGQTTL